MKRLAANDIVLTSLGKNAFVHVSFWNTVVENK